MRWLLKTFPEFVTPKDENPRLLDCWDRQTLSLRMERSKGDTTAIYAVSLRLAGIDLDPLLQKSGHGPTYFETRNDDGRSHDDSFRVVWMGKSDKATALMHAQSLDHWACLVRAGDRFGVRVHQTDAAITHKQLKPQTPYLDSAHMSNWIAGPFPFGATKQSLTKLFQV